MSRAWGRRAGSVLVAALVVAACGDSTGGDRTLARVPDGAGLSAVAGWIGWSTERRDGWHLVTLHDGHVSEPAVAPRRDAFDLDLGTDARGAAVATFSRCRYRRSGHGGIEPFACRLRVLDLAAGREHAAGVPEPAGVSDVSPSMWHGSIAFGRTAASHEPDLAHLMLARPGAGGLRDLGTGPQAGVAFGRVGQMDLGPQQLAFEWAFAGGEYGETDIVAVRLRDRHRTILGGSFESEACMGDADDIEVGSPTLHRGQVLFVESDYSCYRGPSFVKRYGAGSRRRMHSLRIRGSLQQIASDGRRLYGLFAGPSEDPENEAPSCRRALPCRLRVLGPKDIARGRR